MEEEEEHKEVVGEMVLRAVDGGRGRCSGPEELLKRPWWTARLEAAKQSKQSLQEALLRVRQPLVPVSGPVQTRLRVKKRVMSRWTGLYARTMLAVTFWYDPSAMD